MQLASAAIWSMQYCARRDLRVQASTDLRRAVYFNVLDPLTRQSYRVGELELAVLEALRKPRKFTATLELLRTKTDFANVSEQQLFAVLEQLQRCGLVRAVDTKVSPSGTSLTQSKHSKFNLGNKAQASLSSFVVWQLRGLQPDTWLATIAPYSNALFTLVAVRWWLVAMAVTLCGVLLEFPRLASQSASWQWIVHPVQGSSLFAIFIATRALHELGHAIVCKRHGIRCPDIGLFLILGAPCVYCDVSESWQLPSRWQRAAVAAAGMYVELIVATLAAWVWMMTVEGPANTLALQTMFVCSVSTFLINANPLMRFDGYYILSDILDEANLRGRADALAETWLYGWVLGRKAASSRLNPMHQSHHATNVNHVGLSSFHSDPGSKRLYESLLCGFSWMGWVYRAGLSLAIAGLLVSLYEAWNIAWFGRTLAVLILISWWGVPSVKLAKNLLQVAGRTKTRWRLAGVSLLLLGCICLLPLPYRQFASGWVQPAELQGVFATIGGTLWEDESSKGDSPKAGELVDKGTELFVLHDPHTALATVRAEGVEKRTAARVAELRRMQSSEWLTSEETHKHAESMAALARAEESKLDLRAPWTGRLLVMPAAQTTGPWSSGAEPLRSAWDQPTQVGRYVPAGTMLAAVCDDRFMAIIPLNDQQLEWIAEGTEVRVRCAHRPNEVHVCEVLDIVNLHDTAPAARLLNSEVLQGTSGTQGGSGSQASTCSTANAAARIRLPKGLEVPSGGSVDASFVAPSQTVASLANRWLQQNLRWLSD